MWGEIQSAPLYLCSRVAQGQIRGGGVQGVRTPLPQLFEKILFICNTQYKLLPSKLLTLPPPPFEENSAGPPPPLPFLNSWICPCGPLSLFRLSLLFPLFFPTPLPSPLPEAFPSPPYAGITLSSLCRHYPDITGPVCRCCNRQCSREGTEEALCLHCGNGALLLLHRNCVYLAVDVSLGLSSTSLPLLFGGKFSSSDQC